jgi:hypothetical protein
MLNWFIRCGRLWFCRFLQRLLSGGRQVDISVANTELVRCTELDRALYRNTVTVCIPWPQFTRELMNKSC